MKRNLAFLLIMTSATLAQTPTLAQNPATKPSAVTVKAVPKSTSKPQASTVKASVPTVSKPATVSVQPAPSKPAVKVPVKTVAAMPSSAKPAAAAPAKAVAVTPAYSKPQATNAKVPLSTAAKPMAVPAKVAVVNAKPATAAKVEAKVPVKEAPKAAVKVPAKEAPKQAAVKAAPKGQTTVAVQDSKANEADKNKKDTPKAINAVGHRDPFVSPVVNLGAVGSGCSSGKRCLAIDQIALKGVVKSDVGMIAVVVNSMDKAYFLRENDPVFNGYVVKITGDSIVFKETFHDRLGKQLTRDVTKTIARPAV